MWLIFKKLKVKLTYTDPGFRCGNRTSYDFRSKRKWIARLNLLASLKNSFCINRLVEAVPAHARFCAVYSRSKTLTITEKIKQN